MNLVNTVEDNRIQYSERDYSKAVLARKVQKIIGRRPSTKTFLSIVDRNLFQNCPVKREDIIVAERIFGPEVGSGRTCRPMNHMTTPCYQERRVPFRSAQLGMLKVGTIFIV